MALGPGRGVVGTPGFRPRNREHHLHRCPARCIAWCKGKPMRCRAQRHPAGAPGRMPRHAHTRSPPPPPACRAPAAGQAAAQLLTGAAPSTIGAPQGQAAAVTDPCALSLTFFPANYEDMNTPAGWTQSVQSQAGKPPAAWAPGDHPCLPPAAVGHALPARTRLAGLLRRRPRHQRPAAAPAPTAAQPLPRRLPRPPPPETRAHLTPSGRAGNTRSDIMIKIALAGYPIPSVHLAPVSPYTRVGGQVPVSCVTGQPGTGAAILASPAAFTISWRLAGGCAAARYPQTRRRRAWATPPPSAAQPSVVVPARCNRQTRGVGDLTLNPQFRRHKTTHLAAPVPVRQPLACPDAPQARAASWVPS